MLTDTDDVDIQKLEGFLHEACLLMDLKHANILQTLGVVWRDGDRPLILLPYIKMGDLGSYVKKDTVGSEFGSYNISFKKVCNLESSNFMLLITAVVMN